MSEQSKAWSDALKRAARLIQQHYGITRALTQEETVDTISRLKRRKEAGKFWRNESGDHLLAQLEAAE